MRVCKVGPEVSEAYRLGWGGGLASLPSLGKSGGAYVVVTRPVESNRREEPGVQGLNQYCPTMKATRTRNRAKAVTDAGFWRPLGWSLVVVYVYGQSDWAPKGPLAHGLFLASGILGVGIVLLSIVRFFSPRIQSWYSTRRESSIAAKHERGFHFTPMSVGDIPAGHLYLIERFDVDTPTQKAMKEWLMAYPDAFIVMKKRATVDAVIEGIFKLLPLTKAAVTQLLKGKLSGTTFEKKHIATSSRTTAGYYVGDVACSPSQRAGAAILERVAATWAPMLKSGIPVYARPLTRAGKRVMKNEGFVQASNDAPPELRQLCVLRPERINFRKERSSAMRTRIKSGALKVVRVARPKGKRGAVVPLAPAAAA